MAIICGIALISRGQLGRLFKDLARYPASVLVMAVSENIAWVAYAVAMSLIAIAVATGLSESSIIVAVLLGLFINKERLQRHQKIGLVAAIAAAILLAFVTRQQIKKPPAQISLRVWISRESEDLSALVAPH